MIVQNNRCICSIDELASLIAGRIVVECPGDSNFHTVDYAVLDPDECADITTDDTDLKNVARNASGWYGIRRIETGFDDAEDLHLCSDYYGGGATRFVTIIGGCDDKNIKQEIIHLITGTLSYDFDKLANIVLIAETNYAE